MENVSRCLSLSPSASASPLPLSPPLSQSLPLPPSPSSLSLPPSPPPPSLSLSLSIVSRAYDIQYDGFTTEFNVSSSAVHCLPVGNILRMSNCVIINIYVARRINIYVARRKQYNRLLLSHLPPFNGIILCPGVFTVFGIFTSMKQVCL